MITKKVKHKAWPYNLIEDVLSTDLEIYEIYLNPPDDIDLAVDYALSAARKLYPKQTEYLLQYYHEGLIIKEISDRNNNLNVNRIRRELNKVLEYLGSDNVIRFCLKYGMVNGIAESRKYIMHNNYLAGYNDALVSNSSRYDNLQYKYNSIYLFSEISELNLSNRTYNALVKGGIHSITELLACNVQDLFKIDNCGALGIRNIILALEARGFNTRKYKEEYNAFDIKDELKFDLNEKESKSKSGFIDLIPIIDDLISITK
jgi:hypothetical protein